MCKLVAVQMGLWGNTFGTEIFLRQQAVSMFKFSFKHKFSILNKAVFLKPVVREAARGVPPNNLGKVITCPIKFHIYYKN